jgi:UDP:flavonoid glycosyltransferase YjiC (YdhE family)
MQCRIGFISSSNTKWLSRIVLHQELQKYLDEAPHGVIYFSMGSNLQSSSMPESKRDAFLGAFSKLKQHVLWKWESDTLPGQPNNVKLGKWLPQSDILGEYVCSVTTSIM